VGRYNFDSIKIVFRESQNTPKTLKKKLELLA
jgi:hypothetical protein